MSTEPSFIDPATGVQVSIKHDYYKAPEDRRQHVTMYLAPETVAQLDAWAVDLAKQDVKVNRGRVIDYAVELVRQRINSEMVLRADGLTVLKRKTAGKRFQPKKNQP